MTTHPHYDTWKLTTSQDAHSVLPRLTPSTVRKNLVVEDAGVTIDLWGHYCTHSGQLVSVQLSDRAPHISPAAVDTALQALGVTIPHWDDALDDDTLGDLINAAGADAEADWADSRRD